METWTGPHDTQFAYRYKDDQLEKTLAGANKFGTWDDWSEADISYLLHELSDGHLNDCGEYMHGFAMATSGINIAMLANSEPNTDTAAAALRYVWEIARWMCHRGWENVDDPKIMKAYEDIFDASIDWAPAIFRSEAQV